MWGYSMSKAVLISAKLCALVALFEFSAYLNGFLAQIPQILMIATQALRCGGCMRLIFVTYNSADPQLSRLVLISGCKPTYLSPLIIRSTSDHQITASVKDYLDPVTFHLNPILGIWFETHVILPAGIPDISHFFSTNTF